MPAAAKPRPAASPSPSPTRLTRDEVARELRLRPIDALEILEKFRVPVLRLSERRWLVDATAFRRFLADLEQQSRDRVAQNELEAEYVKPAAARSRKGGRR